MNNQDHKAEAIRLWRDDNSCWLDGEPAKVVGWKENFPTVVQLDGPLAFQWSWAAVNLIMGKDRQFKSNP